MENQGERDTTRYPPLHEQLDRLPLHLFWRIEAAFAVSPAKRIMTRSSHKQDRGQFGFGRCLIPFSIPGPLKRRIVTFSVHGPALLNWSAFLPWAAWRTWGTVVVSLPASYLCRRFLISSVLIRNTKRAGDRQDASLPASSLFYNDKRGWEGEMRLE